MKLDNKKKILIVGLGLMGGSYAKALKKLGFHISAITENQSSVDYAIKEKIIDEGTTEADEKMIGKADVVIFALYPNTFIDWIEKNQKYFKAGAFITDVTGVKKSIVYKIQDILRDDVEFVSAHPMAGRETSGVENSTEKIFIGANYIVTPTKRNTKEAIEACKELGRLLGFSNVAELTPEEHDDMVGFVSQLTHCIAIALMTCNDYENIENFTGNSFRDLTRIAKINDLMWSELFIENKDALLNQMDMFIKQFNNLKKMLKNEDVEGIRKMMRHSTKRRELFDKQKEVISNE